MGLITIALLAVFRLQAQNLDFQSEAQFITMAKHLAQHRISQIQASEVIAEGSDTGEFGDQYPGFLFREEIMEVADLADLFKVKVSVLLEAGNQSKDMSVETYVYRGRGDD